jgi:hypothetical protein
MKNFINFVLNLIIAVALSFSFVYALTTTLNMTYGVKDVLIPVCLVVVIASIALGSKLSVKISAIVSVFAVAGGFIYFLKKPFVFKLVYNKAALVFLWFVGYVNREVPLNAQYQRYTLLVLSIIISLIVYIFAVKKFSFHLLLIGGVSLFVAQWMLDYFVNDLPFYVFVFFILICYFKHIYLRNTKVGKGATRQAPAAFLILSAPLCAVVFILAYYMPASDKPIEWDWMDSKIASVNDYIKTRLDIGNSGYFTISSAGFGDDSTRLGGNIHLGGFSRGKHIFKWSN